MPTPLKLDLPAGVHWICLCGRSIDKPYCDGGHKGTGIDPVKVELAEAANVAICRCERTATPPYCDGSHKSK